MCRWFAYIGKEACLLEDVLVTPQNALSKQVQHHFLPKLVAHETDRSIQEQKQIECDLRNRLFNVDGYGLAWYTLVKQEFGEGSGPFPCVYKTIQPPMNDGNFRSICSNTSTFTLFAHIRAATSTAINTSNNHPFTFGKHVFMHNGTIAHFSIIRRRLSLLISQPVFELMSGTTDSEHFAALYITYLGDINIEHPLPHMLQCLKKTIQTIVSLQKELVSQVGPSSLNIATTDGNQLIALRFRNHPTEQPPSLYYSVTAGISLNRKFPGHPDHKNGQNSSDGQALKHEHEHGKHIIVASEPTTYKEEDWDLVPKNHFVIVDSDSNHSLHPVDSYLCEV